MRCANPLRFGAIVLFGSIAFASCSNTTDDALVNACKLIVDTCHRGTSVGDCMDDLGALSPECIDCIGSSTKCGYSECQVQITGCRIPPWLINPKDVIDAGLRSPDGGSAPDSSDSGTDG